jgi:alkylation response protein AidB-like acyl-CoA dehydrogenase
MTAAAPPSEAELVGRTEDLLPLLRDNAARAEADRRLPADVVDALADAGVFRMSVPRRFGGLQTDLPTQFEVIRTLARGCGSTSWVSALYAVCGWWASLFGDDVQEEVFADPGVRVAGIVSPLGRLTADGDGFRLNGTWPFNTGSLHAQWNVVATLREHDGGALEPYLVILPMSDLEVRDDWRVAGMAATGSNSTVAEDVALPAARAMPMGPLFGGDHRSERNRGETMYSYAVFPFLLSLSYGTPIGMAQGAIEAFAERAPTRRTSFDDLAPQAEDPITQLRIAEATMQVECALALARDTTASIHRHAAEGVPLDRRARVRARANVAYTTRLSLRAVQTVHEMSGASVGALDAPIGRFLRDSSLLANHAFLGYDAHLRLLGGDVMGVQAETVFL